MSDQVDDAVRDADDTRSGLSTAPAEVDSSTTVVGLGVLGWVRWGWRTLTSMRTALVLLFLLAVASVPGSVFPQRGTDPIKVTQYLADDPTKGEILDRLGMFDVFASPWFAAIYLLLFISLAGCVIPRSLQHWKAMRSRPPAAPRNLSRLPEHRRVETDAEASEVLASAAALLRGKRWRVDVADDSVAAEKGYSRETGNLVFHLALLVLLLGVALGSLGGFRGNVVVREGSSFANTLSQFDSFAPGRGFDPESLQPFSFTLDDFTAQFERGGPQSGAPRQFVADVTVVSEPGAVPEKARIEVNAPLVIGGEKVFLVGHGYAPTITVTDKDGEIVFRDSVVCLPQDGNFSSTCVVKVPDASPQLGLTGFFLPTAAVDDIRGPHSTFPATDDPAVFLSAWEGDLGLDSGRPQSVFKLETTNMTRLGIEALRPGETWTLEDGTTVSFDGYVQFASFAIAQDPGKEIALVASIAAMTGLALSLLVRRRRVWVRVASGASGITVVDVAGLTRSEHASVADEVDEVASALGSPAGASTAQGSTGAEGAPE
ncbi:cytochrome c biogenesis protein ResB [Longivirga aurantiaca]|uniref:Cytochrome c biogenesis protein ResB n=1 Tax=Longivirga aurantiaca TaxID=1837743 RepID=A0ABW1SYV6_9ACTN